MISDTTPEVERILIELRRGQTPGQRISNALEMSEMLRSFELGMIRKEHPDATGEELCYYLMVKRYGQELARKAFGIKVMTA